ncbi:DUF6458 family protein [Aeromicrobium sp. Leaf291]|uniref:DUF6458 family protein n=1 Tax=Aeromicrobium sp. Leaf291 TaxID=1736325 RepID=UPI0006FE8794|nr:DUF6458 family protein [Aeromicrobium sp. Leaf291]KQP82209.1 hypothetical protein ASF35_12285 [Aeromicrobium sp. Leaf291]
MQIGSSLFLLAAGAILAFAVQDAVNGVDLTMVGFILIAVGALGLIVSLILSGRSRDRRGEVPPPR